MMASAGAAQNCARCLGSSPRRGVVRLCLQTWAHGGAVRWGTGSQARGRPLLLRHNGLVVYADGPLNLDRKAEDMSELFRPFHTLLRKIRDLLQTLTEDELHTLERSLCVSQDVEFPVPADGPVPPALAPAFPTPPPPEELLPAKAKSPEAELACSMQYDDQELEQLNRMVCRAGDAMSSLLSPPSACQSPAHRPGPEGSPQGVASPGGGLVQPGSEEEEGRVFFMDDVDGSTEAPGSPCRWTGGPRAEPQERGQGGQAGASVPSTSAEEEDVSNNNNVEDDKTWAAGPNSCSCLDAPPHLDGWEVIGDDVETAEMIAHRTGGMKLSATVIFNPKSPTSLDCPSSAPEGSGNGISPSEPRAGGTEGGSHELSTNCLLNSCVCCGGCGGGREDTAESLQDKCSSPGGVISASYVGMAKASAKGAAERPEEAQPALETLPVGTPAPLPSEDTPDSQEPEAPAFNKCLALPSGPPADAADRSHGGGDGGQQKEPAARPQDARQPAEAKEGCRRLSGSSGSPAGSCPLDKTTLEVVPAAAREKIRSRFHSSHDLIHRLFVCISGVADQLQTNYASDLRSILKTLFEVMATKPEMDNKEKLKKVTQTLRSAALEDCALCQETLSSPGLSAKTRDGDLEDLLLPLLLPLGPAAPLRAGEAGPRVHTLLHVPRHTLLQRQGGHVTRAGTPRTLQGLKGLPGRLPTLPTLRPDAGSRRVFTVLHPAAAAAEDTSGMSRASTPATLSSPPVGATRRSASAAGAPRVPGGCLVRAGRLSSCLSTCPAEVPPGGSATAEGLLSAVTGSAVVVRALGSLSTWGTPGDGDTYQRVWTQSSTQLPWELANPKGPQCPSPRCPEPKAPSSSPCATRARSCRALAQQHAPHCTQGSFR
ncbi:lateral signaling target protein 2 homolog isoform X3 [Desmodus rotundus]|uniref:lateral signaling target protein 2 homolog isoform X3 n=1 Tax=Desmodus rotundus TaxID=9430 RepID=UPI002380C722|nr:lateral signaling target protein 2 homolog isoform X3 [Desmodus rotundus]